MVGGYVVVWLSGICDEMWVVCVCVWGEREVRGESSKGPRGDGVMLLIHCKFQVTHSVRSIQCTVLQMPQLKHQIPRDSQRVLATMC